MLTINDSLTDDIYALKRECVAFRNTRSNCKTPYPSDIVNAVIVILAQGYSMSELAQKTGISRSAIYRWNSDGSINQMSEPRRLRVVKSANTCIASEEIRIGERRSRCKIQVSSGIAILINTDDVTIQLIRILQEATNAS